MASCWWPRHSRVDYGVVDPAAVAAASGPALGGVTWGTGRSSPGSLHQGSHTGQPDWRWAYPFGHTCWLCVLQEQTHSSLPFALPLSAALIWVKVGYLRPGILKWQPFNCRSTRFICFSSISLVSQEELGRAGLSTHNGTAFFCLFTHFCSPGDTNKVNNHLWELSQPWGWSW